MIDYTGLKAVLDARRKPPEIRPEPPVSYLRAFIGAAVMAVMIYVLAVLMGVM